MPGDCQMAASVRKAPRCTGLTNSDFEILLSGTAVKTLSGVFKKMVFGDRYALYSCNAKIILCFLTNVQKPVCYGGQSLLRASLYHCVIACKLDRIKMNQYLTVIGYLATTENCIELNTGTQK